MLQSRDWVTYLFHRKRTIGWAVWFLCKVEGGTRITDGFMTVCTLDQVLETSLGAAEMRRGSPRLMMEWVQRCRGMENSRHTKNYNSAAAWDEAPQQKTRLQRQIGTIQGSVGLNFVAQAMRSHLGFVSSMSQEVYWRQRMDEMERMKEKNHDGQGKMRNWNNSARAKGKKGLKGMDKYKRKT